ncbi:hypothetical protein Dimus_017452 [Dionaea muscipula]
MGGRRGWPKGRPRKVVKSVGSIKSKSGSEGPIFPLLRDMVDDSRDLSVSCEDPSLGQVEGVKPLVLQSASKSPVIDGRSDAWAVECEVLGNLSGGGCGGGSSSAGFPLKDEDYLKAVTGIILRARQKRWAWRPVGHESGERPGAIQPVQPENKVGMDEGAVIAAQGKKVEGAEFVGSSSGGRRVVKGRSASKASSSSRCMFPALVFPLFLLMIVVISSALP